QNAAIAAAAKRSSGEPLFIAKFLSALAQARWTRTRILPDYASRRAEMQAAIDGEKNSVDARREEDEQKRHRHDRVYVVEADGVHQQVAQSMLRREHFTQHGADQRQRKADAQSGEDLGNRRGKKNRAHHRWRAQLQHASG